ncbi:MAG: serine/threonine protein phosphatase [Clostridiaceae bacterium]|nr:serine/threonine protein phosphatase [Clostridiaceae bacterium]
MALFAISDLHLSLGVNKPMDVFGDKWNNYMERIKENWEKQVEDTDYVVLPGDLSWATYLEQSYSDFCFLNELPGLKIVSKGNHDYWWTTMSKLNKYIQRNKFDKIVFMHNNSILYKDIAICGTRGWNCPGSDGFSKEDEKIYLRELQRFELSIQDGLKNNPREIIAALHYPPFTRSGELQSGFIDLLKKYDIKTCIYGHLHADSHKDAMNGEYDGIRYYLVSSDYVDFTPVKIRD